MLEHTGPVEKELKTFASKEQNEPEGRKGADGGSFL